MLDYDSWLDRGSSSNCEALEVVEVCKTCGEDIHESDTYYSIGEEVMCSSCVETIEENARQVQRENGCEVCGIGYDYKETYEDGEEERITDGFEVQEYRVAGEKYCMCEDCWDDFLSDSRETAELMSRYDYENH